MTIYKHVFKQNKKIRKKKTSRPDTFCVGRSAFVYSFSTKDQKKTVSMIRKYLTHTLQTKNRPDIIIHFIKQEVNSISNANCMRKNICPFQYLLSPLLSYST